MQRPARLLLTTLSVFAALAGAAESARTPGAARSEARELATSGIMSIARAGHQATVLKTGEVLISGGCAGSGCENFQSSCELYLPGIGSFQPTGAMVTARVNHLAALLPDGRVLVAGGWTESGTTAEAEIYDPVNRRFTRARPMAERRAGAAAVVLRGGRLLVAGGETTTGDALASVEVFDPSTGLFTVAGQMLIPRSGPAGVLLTDGRVLLVGGHRARNEEERSAEIFDPKSGTAVRAGEMAHPRHKHAAVLLKDGRVLIVGGSAVAAGGDVRYASTEIYDVAARTFSPGPTLKSARHKIKHSVVVLPSGDVIVAGGAAQAERWRPGAASFITIAGPPGGRAEFATASLLRNGNVLVLGGYDVGMRPVASARLLAAD